MTDPALDHKYVTFIVSGGRTGTTFFGDLLSRVIDQSFSVHEPDLYAGLNVRTWNAVRTFGPYHMILGRALGKTGIRNLTQNYLAGKMTEEALASAIRNHRERYYSSITPPYIIESYSQWFGILPGLSHVFRHYKVIGIIRDPRTWVQSWINYQGLHDSKDRVLKFGAKRLNPRMIGDTQYAGRWDSMSDFEKLCWQWLTITRTLKKYEAADERIRLYRFEDLFLSEAREQTIRDMLSFIATFEDRSFSYDFDVSLLGDIRNRSGGQRLSHWETWTQGQCTALDAICGAAMRECGYGLESDWTEKLSALSAAG